MLNVPFDMSSVGCLMSGKCKVEKLKYFYLTILTLRRVMTEIIMNSINKLKTKSIFHPKPDKDLIIVRYISFFILCLIWKGKEIIWKLLAIESVI